MNRRAFLRKLLKVWEENGEMAEPLTIADLLDDAACMGMEGASDLYMLLLQNSKKGVI